MTLRIHTGPTALLAALGLAAATGACSKSELDTAQQAGVDEDLAFAIHPDSTMTLARVAESVDDGGQAFLYDFVENQGSLEVARDYSSPFLRDQFRLLDTAEYKAKNDMYDPFDEDSEDPYWIGCANGEHNRKYGILDPACTRGELVVRGTLRVDDPSLVAGIAIRRDTTECGSGGFERGDCSVGEFLEWTTQTRVDYIHNPLEPSETRIETNCIGGSPGSVTPDFEDNGIGGPPGENVPEYEGKGMVGCTYHPQPDGTGMLTFSASLGMGQIANNIYDTWKLDVYARNPRDDVRVQFVPLDGSASNSALVTREEYEGLLGGEAGQSLQRTGGIYLMGWSVTAVPIPGGFVVSESAIDSCQELGTPEDPTECGRTRTLNNLLGEGNRAGFGVRTKTLTPMWPMLEFDGGADLVSRLMVQSGEAGDDGVGFGGEVIVQAAFYHPNGFPPAGSGDDGMGVILNELLENVSLARELDCDGELRTDSYGDFLCGEASQAMEQHDVLTNAWMNDSARVFYPRDRSAGTGPNILAISYPSAHIDNVTGAWTLSVEAHQDPASAELPMLIGWRLLVLNDMNSFTAEAVTCQSGHFSDCRGDASAE